MANLHTNAAIKDAWLESLNTDAACGRKAANNLLILGGSQTIKVFLQILGMVVFSRILSPADFGLFAMSATIINFLILFKDSGLTSATIQQKDLAQRQMSTLFWLNVLIGLGLAIITMACAPAFAYFYKRSELVPIITVLASGFFLGALGAQHDALMRRRMSFRQVALSDVLSLAISVSVAIAMAILGFGVWSLVLQKVLQMLLSSMINWTLCSWRPTLTFQWNDASQQFRFGAHVSSFNFVNYFSRNADNILIGWRWGASSLGVYSKAYDLLLAPISQVSAPLNSMMQPLLARLRADPARYRTTYQKVMVPANLCMVPIAAIMIVMPSTVVSTIFGPGWEKANDVVMWLGISVATQIASGSTGFVLISQQRSRDYAAQGLVNSGLTILGFIVSLPYGIEALAATYSITGLLLRLPYAFWNTGSKGPLSATDLWLTLKLPAWAMAWIVPGLLLLDYSIGHLHPLVRLPLAILCTTTVFLLSVLATRDGKELYRQCAKVIKDRLT